MINRRKNEKLYDMIQIRKQLTYSLVQILFTNVYK